MTTPVQESIRSLEAELALADAPALFCVWVADDEAKRGVTEACRAGGRAVSILAGRAGLDVAIAGTAPGLLLVEGGLSSVPVQDRPAINQARQRLLTGQAVIVLVEPRGEESSLRADYPDVFSVARSHHRVGAPPDLDEPDHFVPARGEAVSPSSLTMIPCPRCGKTMTPGRTTISFRMAPEATRTQGVDGWVCPCGEHYVPGSVAREAYARAFQKDAGRASTDSDPG